MVSEAGLRWPEFDGVRTYLFVPADDPRKIASALRSDAGAVILDLEDAVAPARKADARRAVRELRVPPGRLLIVRVNGSENLIRPDAHAAAAAGAAAIMVPKANLAVINGLDTALPMFALIETARGLRDAYALASMSNVIGLALGAVDLSADLGLRPAGGLELLGPRYQLVRDSAAGGAISPIDGITPETRDLDLIADAASAARSLGMGAKLCIHPAQINPIEQAFAPSQEEVRHAERVVAAHEDAVRSGRGAVAVDGEMIDVAVVRQARRVLSKGAR